MWVCDSPFNVSFLESSFCVVGRLFNIGSVTFLLCTRTWRPGKVANVCNLCPMGCNFRRLSRVFVGNVTLLMKPKSLGTFAQAKYDVRNEDGHLDFTKNFTEGKTV